MDLRQLRYYLEIVEQGSVSRAAARLNVAQPALSLHLRNMEAELGTALLIRSRSGVTPTEAGEILRRSAQRILSEQALVMDEIRNLGTEPAGEVRLGLPGTISDILTVPLIEAARRRYPQIRLTVSEAMSGFVANWLRDGKVELALLYLDAREPGLECTRLAEEQLVLFAAPRHLAMTQATLADLSTQPLILPTRSHGLRQMLERAAEGAGVTLAPIIEADSYKTIKALVMRGGGVSILPLQAVAAEAQAGKVVVRRFDPALWRSLWMVNRTNAPGTRSVRAIRSLIVEETRRLVEDGAWTGAQLTG